MNKQQEDWGSMNEDIHYSTRVLFFCDLKKRRKRGGISYAPSARYGPERGDGWGGEGALFTTVSSFFIDRRELLLSDKFWNGQQIGRTKEKCWCI